MKQKNGNHNNAATVVTFLNRHQIDYLDKVGKDCFFKYGHKLSRSKILFELVNFFLTTGIDIKKIDLEHECLCDGMLRLMRDENNDAQ